MNFHFIIQAICLVINAHFFCRAIANPETFSKTYTYFAGFMVLWCAFWAVMAIL